MVMTIALTFVGCDNKVGDIALEKGQQFIFQKMVKYSTE